MFFPRHAALAALAALTLTLPALDVVLAEEAFCGGAEKYDTAGARCVCLLWERERRRRRRCAGCAPPLTSSRPQGEVGNVGELPPPPPTANLHP